MHLRQLKAFCTEVLKIAEARPLPLPLDPDMRALRAERKHEEHLQGGQLASNDPKETGFIPKIASDDQPFRPPAMTALKARMKDPGSYQQARDYTLSGLFGATTAGTAVNLAEKIRGGALKPIPGKYYAGAALLGGAGAVADRAYRYRKKLLKKPKTIGDKMKAQAAKEKTANLSGFTPAKALKASGQVKQFQPGRYHTGNTKQAPGQIGKEGRLPRSG